MTPALWCWDQTKSLCILGKRLPTELHPRIFLGSSPTLLYLYYFYFAAIVKAFARLWPLSSSFRGLLSLLSLNLLTLMCSHLFKPGRHFLLGYAADGMLGDRCSATKLDPQQNPARLCWALGYGQVYFQMGGGLRKLKCLP